MTKNRSTRISLISALAILALTSLSTTAGIDTANAKAKTCTASKCNKKNPETYGCGSKAKSLTNYTASYLTWDQNLGWVDYYGDQTMYLRYSAKCQAVWMRLKVPDDLMYEYHPYYFRIDSCSEKCNSKISRTWNPGTAYTNDDYIYLWSSMVPFYKSGLKYTRLCARDTYVKNGKTTHGKEGCSGWFELG